MFLGGGEKLANGCLENKKNRSGTVQEREGEGKGKGFGEGQGQGQSQGYPKKPQT